MQLLRTKFMLTSLLAFRIMFVVVDGLEVCSQAL